MLNIEKHSHQAEATAHVPGAELFANAEADDMYAAIDKLADKLDRQLLKHKEKPSRDIMAGTTEHRDTRFNGRPPADIAWAENTAARFSTNWSVRWACGTGLSSRHSDEQHTISQSRESASMSNALTVNDWRQQELRALVICTLAVENGSSKPLRKNWSILLEKTARKPLMKSTKHWLNASVSAVQLW